MPRASTEVPKKTAKITPNQGDITGPISSNLYWLASDTALDSDPFGGSLISAIKAEEVRNHRKN